MAYRFKTSTARDVFNISILYAIIISTAQCTWCAGVFTALCVTLCGKQCVWCAGVFTALHVTLCGKQCV